MTCVTPSSRTADAARGHLSCPLPGPPCTPGPVSRPTYPSLYLTLLVSEAYRLGEPRCALFLRSFPLSSVPLLSTSFSLGSQMGRRLCHIPVRHGPSATTSSARDAVFATSLSATAPPPRPRLSGTPPLPLPCPPRPLRDDLVRQGRRLCQDLVRRHNPSVTTSSARDDASATSVSTTVPLPRPRPPGTPSLSRPRLLPTEGRGPWRDAEAFASTFAARQRMSSAR